MPAPIRILVLPTAFVRSCAAFTAAFFLALIAYVVQAQGASVESQPQLSYCSTKQIELFSCEIKTKETVALCLSNRDLTVELVRTASDGVRRVIHLSGLRQIVHQNAHGNYTVLEANSPNGAVTLYVDRDRYDMSTPALSTASQNGTETGFCVDSSVRVPLSTSQIRGKPELTSLFNLGQFGISSPLGEDDEPDWPTEK
jgi:hypothetical protein